MSATVYGRVHLYVCIHVHMYVYQRASISPTEALVIIRFMFYSIYNAACLDCLRNTQIFVCRHTHNYWRLVSPRKL